MKSPQNIVILGGGSAGWMTASTLIHDLPNKNITVVESPSIPNISVGESTTNEIMPWLYHLGIDIKDFMRGTEAIFKLGVKFSNFYRENDEPWYTVFGLADFQNTAMNLEDWKFKKFKYPETHHTNFTETHYPQFALFKDNKFLNEMNPDFFPYNPEKDVGLQLNAVKLGQYLADQYAIPRGVKRIYATVTSVKQNEDGVEALVLDDGTELTGDIFIDCSGFKSLLIGQTLDEEFISTKEELPHNRAFFTPVEYTDKELELQNFTHSIALKNGWAWNTPIWSRIGTGYAFSDQFVDEETALQEFKDHLDSDKMVVYNPNRSKEVEIRKLFMRNGYYKRAWVKNVIAIGLSAAFLDPLEGAGLYFVHEMSSKIANTFYKDYYNGFDIQVFNRYWETQVTTTKDFIQIHFILSQRDDSQYWLNVNKLGGPKNLIDQFKEVIRTGEWGDRSGVGYLSVGAGMQYDIIFQDYVEKLWLAQRVINVDVVNDLVPYWEAKDKKAQNLKEFVKDLPTQYQYLKENIHEDL